MSEASKARERRSRDWIKYDHGLDEATLLELEQKSNLAILRALDGNIANANPNQRRKLKRQGLAKLGNTKQPGKLRIEFTAKGKALLEELRNE